MRRQTCNIYMTHGEISPDTVFHIFAEFESNLQLRRRES